MRYTLKTAVLLLLICGSVSAFADSEAYAQQIDRIVSGELERLEGDLKGAEYWIEPFYEGLPVSVSVICHGDGFTFLPATEQVFDQKPLGEFVSSRFPIDKVLERRARRLAEKTIRLLPPTRGYIGLDMVLGAETDWLIEINPRLTMSYLELRKVCSFNLAVRMLSPGG